MKKLLLSFVSLFLIAGSAHAASAIVTGNVNFRSGPGTKYSVRGVIPAGAPVYINGCSGNWCTVRYANRNGWISKRYLTNNSGYYSRPSHSSSTIIIAPNRYRDNDWYWNKHKHPRPPHGHRPGRPHGGGHRPR